MTPEQMIACAKEAGLEIPLVNRVEYPLLFLDVTYFEPGGVFTPEKRHDGEDYLEPESIPKGFLK